MKSKKLIQYLSVSKLGLILALSLISSHILYGQSLDANRTASTKIADLLNRFPAENSTVFDKNMEEMASLEAKDLTQMILMLTENGSNDPLEYAISGFAFYASQDGKEALADKAVEAYGQSLSQIGFDEGKAFLIENLKIMGNNEAVPFLSPYLENERLSSPAARALASINTEDAEKALIAALENAESDAIILPLIEALGDLKSHAAAGLIAPYASAENEDIKKIALYSLSNIGDLSSEAILADAAEANGYKYEETNAASEYLKYIKNLADQGETKKALKLAEKLHRKAKNDDQSHTRIGALNLMITLAPEKATRLLQKASLSPISAYRNAALKLAGEGNISNNLESWAKLLQKAENPVKVDILRTLGKLEGDSILELVRPHLQNSDPAVKIQAIASAVLIGENKVLDDLLGMTDSATEEELDAIKRALLTMGGNNVSSEVAKTLPEASDEAKIALIQVLAARPAAQHMEVVLGQVSSSNNAVKNTTLSALYRLAAPAHLDQLVNLLKSHQNPEELKLIQKAIIAANAQQDSKAQQTDWALQTLKTLDQDKQVYLYDVLANTGGTTALSSLNDIYQKGNASQKKAALGAIANWADAEAMDVLYDIAKNETNQENSNQALEGYINLIGKTSQEAEGKVLLLRKALEIVKSDANKQLVLHQLARYPTFQALLVAGEYLDASAAVQQQAARAVMAIALADPSIYGEEVRAIVQKTKEVISGQDSEYHKTSLQKHLDEMPKERGFYSIFNGENLDGWKGLVANPIKRADMSTAQLEKAQEKANQEMRSGWEVQDGLLVFTGKGNNLATAKKYGDFEMFVDWKITKDGDAGIYLRGTPQVQIWDIARVDVGAEVGSGGLYNNQTHPSKPLKVADNPVGEWNTFHIIMKGDRVTVELNGELVVDNVILENYWDRSLPIFTEEQIELQAHGTYVAYRDIFIKELPKTETFKLSEEEKKEGFEVLFDGDNMYHWTGNTTDYVIENGQIVIYPDRGGKGNLFTKKEYSDFDFRFEFKLTPGSNNGLGIRAPLEGDAAYGGMELQILDNTAEIYKNLAEYQYHGSLYGVAPAKKGYLKPVGEWNYQEVRVKGDKIQVELNGTIILDVDISEATENGTKDGKNHPGLKRESGHIGFLGHGDVVYFRNIRIKELKK